MRIKKEIFLRQGIQGKVMRHGLLVLLAAGFLCLRLYGLGSHDFWYDEIGTVHYAQHPWGNWNAPLYWIFMHFWVKIFGISELSLRMPSVIFSFGAVVLTYILGRKLFDRSAALMAACLMGLSPFHLWYAQEARDYSMALFLGLSSTLFLVEAMRRRQVLFWLLYAAASVLGVYTNYFFLILCLAQAGCFFLFGRGARLTGFIVFCFVAAAFSFYLPMFVDKFIYVQGGFWIPVPEWGSLRNTVENFILGYTGTAFSYRFADCLVAVLLALACIRAWREKRAASFIFAMLMLAAPVLGVFIFSRLVFPVYLDRGLILFSPFLYLLVAFGAAYARRAMRWALLSGLVLLVLFSSYRFYAGLPLGHYMGAYVKKPVRPVIDFLNGRVSSRDRVCFLHESFQPSFEFYSQDAWNSVFLYDPRIPDESWHRLIQEDEKNVAFHRVIDWDFERLYVLASNWPRDGGIDGAGRLILDWLGQRLRLEEVRNFDGLWVYIYAR